MFGLTLIGQMPVLEHARNGHDGRLWRLWLSYNDDYSNGVYLQLHADGSIWRYICTNNRLTKGEEVKDKS